MEYTFRRKPIQLAVVIPAYRPSEALPELIERLSRRFHAIVVVDDGSGADYTHVFERARTLPGVHLLRHAVNLGKGAALKTAINYVLCNFPGSGIVTADADGQHDPDDIENVARMLLDQPDSLVLGARAFGQDVPLRSRFGNVLTCAIMHALLGRKITDTQTGLRGIPSALLPRLLKIESTGYEFELEMLLAAHHLEVPVLEQPIRTIYEPGNKSSHFNPLIDSMKIYFVLLRFGSVSLMTALFDNLVFFLAYRRTGHILSSQILGRAFAVAFNYTVVRSSVFYSKERHRAVLPKYLLLVVASGTASYAGIRLLSDRFGLNAVVAKLGIETFLFFVNFAVQRLLIFKPREASLKAPEPKPAVQAWLPHALFVLVFAGLVVLEIYGFRTAHLFQQELWYPIGLSRFTRFTGMYLAFAAPLLLMVPWAFAAVLTALILAATALSVGLPAVLSAAFFLLSASALGNLLLHGKPESLEDQLLATLSGTGIYIFSMTLLARLPVNYPWFWGILLAAPLAVDLRRTVRRLTYWVSGICKAKLHRPWHRAAFAFFGFFLVAHWLVVLKPETGSDALAMHLAVPMNIAAHHGMTYQPAQFLWSVMPMGADWCYSIAYLFGGEYAARLLNFAMFLIVAGLLYGAARRWLMPAAAWLLAAAFAATPLVQYVTGSLFVENFVAAMVLGLMAALWRFGETGERRWLYVAMALAGTSLATKVGSFAFLAFALPLAIAEVVRHWKKLGARPWAVCAIALLLLAITGAPTYVIAWQKTGNPIFPFWNQTFPSPLLSPHVDLSDERFHIPLNARTLYDLTFHTGQVYEGQDGSFGFQYLIVVPLALAGLLLSRKHRGIAIAASAWIAAVGAGYLIIRSQPNARYLYASLPLALVAFAAAFAWLESAHRRTSQALAGCLVACTALNGYFISSASYYHKDFGLRNPFSRAAREEYVRRSGPIREVISYYNSHHPHSTILLASDNAIAGLDGTVYENHWHQYSTSEQLEQAFSAYDALQLIKRWHVGYFIAEKPKSGDPVRPLSLERLIATCGVPEFEYGDKYLARFRPDCDVAAPPVTPDRPILAVSTGFYDDFDPAIAYRGDWSHDEAFADADRHTVSYTDIPGAEVSIAFDGKALTYVFTRAPNRGIAAVTIDGAPKGTLDLYAPEVQWQAHVRFCCFGAGRHLAVIRVTGQAAPKARGVFVDLDSFIVE